MFEIDDTGTSGNTLTESPEADDIQAAEPALTSEPSSHERVPLIKFIGKRSLVAHSANKVESISTPPILQSMTQLATAGSSDFVDLPPMYKRVPFTDQEIEIIQLGGAEDEVRWAY